MPPTAVFGKTQNFPPFFGNKSMINFRLAMAKFHPLETMSIDDMRFAAYDPTHAELYLTFRWGPQSREPSDPGMVYRIKLSGDKSEKVVSMFTNPSSQGGKPLLPQNLKIVLT